MITPTVTVLMPVYNAELYLNEAIESILNQTFINFEFLIINDGSIDKSEQIISSYKDHRIRYVKNEANLKLIATLNKGIEMAQGKYIVRMDADDISLPHRLQTQFDFMELHPNVALCGSWFEVLDGKSGVGKYVGNHYEIMMKMLYQCHFCHPSVIMRKSILENFIVKFDPLYTHAEDYDFFIRIGEKFELANIQEILIMYRVHNQSVSQRNKETQSKNSTVIKQNLFKKIGLNMDENQLDFFSTIMQHEYEQTKEYVINVSSFFENLLAANENSVFFEKEFLKIYLAQLWLNVTYNCTSLGLFSFNEFYGSPLNKYITLSITAKIKFFAKAFLKM